MSTSGVDRESRLRSRVLLRRIREALASNADRAQRLDLIVRLIATNMVAEVCSIYVSGPDGALSLAATEGLNRAAADRARFALGEGLVGRIAQTGEPINTDDAANTPGFQFVPGIGEEIYRSFLGAPIRRMGRTLGVLVVQNQAPRRYDEDEVDALELIATVIAEMAEAGALFDAAWLGSEPSAPLRLSGAAAADGVAMGRAILHEPKVVLHNPIADDVATERERLQAAMAAVRGEIDQLTSDAELSDAGEHRDVLEAFRLFAHDRGWLRRLEAAVDSGLSAEAAAEKVQSDARARLQRTADPYLRERLHDLDDLARRLLRTLLGVAPLAPEDLPEDAVLLAESLGPGELLEYGRGTLRGVAMAEGSAGGHAAIVARALNIPLVTGVEDLLRTAETGEPVIIDGDVGRVLLRPDAAVAAAYREKLQLKAQELEAFAALRDKPAETRDGERVTLTMNAGLLTDLPSLEQSGAEGVGLFRTELQYLVGGRAPRRDAQARLYSRVLDSADGRPVVFRTLDMGGDKRLPFLKGDIEENPALGWRAIRIALDRPLLFRTQLQALLRAAEGRDLNVMFPMVATAAEFFEARELLLAEQSRAMARGGGPRRLRIGAMLETPALAYAPRRFFEEADFLSVGGNDLMQFFFAADRGNERVRARYDGLSAPFLRFMRDLVARVRGAGADISFCGEMAGKPIEALALATVGFRSLSMRPASIGPVKRLLRSVSMAEATACVAAALEEPDDHVRERLAAYCAAQSAPR